MSHVTAKVEMSRRAAPFLTNRARFWVVRPRLEGVSAQTLQSGLQTLVSGSYIAFDPGRKGGERTQKFQGLEEPPGVRSSEPGREFVLAAKALGSVGIGTAIYYKDVNVGEVLGYSLREKKLPFELRVFVRAPYDKRVGALTRFWNVSGVRLTNDAQGLRIEMQSLRAALVGGIAFDTPLEDNAGEYRTPGATVAPNPAEFVLYESRVDAELEMHPTVASCAAYFERPINGMSRGSNVTMLGQMVGAVTDVRLARDPSLPQSALSVRVEFVLQPERAMGTAAQIALTPEKFPELIDKGLHVVVESKSFITGEKELSLVLEGGKPGPPLRDGETWVLPSEIHDFNDLSAQLSNVASKVNQIPFDRMGRDLSRTLRHVDEAVSGPELKRSLQSLDAALSDLRELSRQARADVTPVLERLPQIAQQLQQASESASSMLGSSGYGHNSDFQRGATRLMEQLGEAARSIRLLAETLDRHPESILVGKSRAEDK